MLNLSTLFVFLKMTHFLLNILFPLALLSCYSANQKTDTQGDNEKEVVAPLQNEEKGNANDTLLKHTIYTSSDSAKVVKLLKLQTGTDDVLFYARQFIGVPYVASTLEVADPEQLVVNLHELDCTTLVETTLALTMTKRQGSERFADYCQNLQKIRYFHGQMNGYLSRLHYFSWWMHDNTDLGIIEEVKLPNQYTTFINVQNKYMSTHPEKYKYLKKHPEWVDSISHLEQQFNGPDGRYLTQTNVQLPKSKIGCIQNGDIVAIVTTKAGIDYSHLGFAVWGKDGHLHLLNASSIHHKVVEEPKTLYQYLKEHPSSIGIRLWRLR